jgi:UDP-N-acetylglucosamine--N-acetylmuramyl-(pentapeptide) pyrophosphoryl-undecaprenol N-acetylglucosamine transferase
MADAGAAILVPNDEISGDRIATLAQTVLFDRQQLGSMADAASGLGRRDAAVLVADLVEEHARD